MTMMLFGLRIAFMLLLYGFLGLLAWLVWRELQQGSRAPQNVRTAPRGERLTVVAAGDSGYAEGRQFPLQSITTMGRELSSDIIIADSYASSKHARIERHSDGRFWLVDVGSSNGTLLNGQQVRANDPIPLDPGDVISIGKVQLKMT
ncbi:MAG: FHA domain-containing protein [Ardenticatenales bacterium]|nr:FHA domain-containing protein [Ardenticatenales bacterium]